MGDAIDISAANSHPSHQEFEAFDDTEIDWGDGEFYDVNLLLELIRVLCDQVKFKDGCWYFRTNDNVALNDSEVAALVEFLPPGLIIGPERE